MAVVPLQSGCRPTAPRSRRIIASGRALKGTYIKLGKLFASQSDKIVITRMEAERNDFPSKFFDVRGYPAVYLSPKGNDSTPIFFEVQQL